MAKNSKRLNIDLSNTPIFYADQAAGLLLGPHVSRITFGVENEDDEAEYPRPTVTVVIQTSSLIDLVSDLRLILDSEKFKTDMGGRLESTIRKISTGVKASPSDYVKELLIEADVNADEGDSQDGAMLPTKHRRKK